jgi:uncharacterized membrane protein
MSNNLDLQSVVSETIELVKTKWQPMLMAVLLYFVTLLPAIIPILGMIYSFVISGPLLAGLMYTINQIRKGEQTKATDIYKGFGSFGKAFCVILLFNLMVAVGMVFYLFLASSSRQDSSPVCSWFWMLTTASWTPSTKHGQ